MGHHAMIGSHRLAVDVPPALQNLDGFTIAERGAFERLAQPRDLENCWEIAQQDPARSHRQFGMLHNLPRLG